MKTLFCFLFLALPVALASTHGPPPPDTSQDERNVANNAERSSQSEVDRIIRREVARRRAVVVRRAPAPSLSYCGKGFWAKSDALQLCPPATAMKMYTPSGEPFYYCDCSN